MIAPAETPAVDDDSAERRAVSAHEFGERMDDDVGAVLDRPQQGRSGDRVVDDQRDAARMGDLGKRGDVANIARGIADAFTK